MSICIKYVYFSLYISISIIKLANQSKIYFIIDQQIARAFVHYSECISIPLPFYTTQIINPFLNSSSQPITIKGWDFSQLWNPYNVPLV